MKILLFSAAVLAATASVSNAQLLIGMDDTSGADTAWQVDVSTGMATALWSGIEVWGMAADDANGIVYSNDGASLYMWPYNDVNPPTLMGTITETGTGNTLTMVSLSFANGKLYGTRNISVEAFWEIDLTTLEATNVLTYPSTFDFGGTDFNPTDGLFYGTNDGGGAPSGTGLYSIDVLGGNVNPTFVVAYPAGETDIDGCAVGDDNRVWLIEDEPSPLHNYDLDTAMYDPNPPMSPIPTSEVFSGAGYAPGLQEDPIELYCTAKTGLSCGTPAMGFSGTPSASATSGFDIFAGPALGAKAGLVLYGNTGRAALPFEGGLLCVNPPVNRSSVVGSGGTNGACDGEFRLDMNAFASGNTGGNPQAYLSNPGEVINAQFWGRDTLATGSFLSDAIEYTVQP